jgi:hypothetical protein
MHYHQNGPFGGASYKLRHLVDFRANDPFGGFSDKLRRFVGVRTALRLAASIPAIAVIAYAAPVDAKACKSRSAILHPFSANSPWNAPIGSNAKYKDMPLIRREPAGVVTTLTPSGSHKGVNHGANVSIANAKDPLVTVGPSGKSGRGLPLKIHMLKGFYNTDPGNKNCDCQVILHDTSSGKTFDLYAFQDWVGSTSNKLPYNKRLARVAKPVNINGKGYTVTASTKPCASGAEGTRATGTSVLAGLLRGQIANKGGEPIGHALAMELTFRQLAKKRVQPASCVDSTYKKNTGNIPYGAVFAIPPRSKGGCNIDKMGLTEPGKRLAIALRDYGAIVSDRRGKNVAIEADQYLSGSMKQQLQKDFTKLVKQCLKMVTNYNPNSQTVKGGGQKIAPVCGGR